MSASMRNFMEAYEAVHNKEVRDEFYKNQDELSSMNIGRLTDNDLREISEQICEHLFSEGASVSDAELIISELFSESEIVGRQKKAERILDAFAEAFKKIKSKSTDVALESFARYRNNKKLQETWSVRFNQEKRVQRAHGTSVADEVAAVKSGLLSMIEGKMPEGLRKYMEKKGKGHSKDEDKSDSKGGGKPDFLDLDKDGDKKESMKKAAKDKKMSEAYTVTNADKKGNTPAYQAYKAGKKNVKTGEPLYKAADHMKEGMLVKAAQGVEKGVSKGIQKFNKFDAKVTKAAGKAAKKVGMAAIRGTAGAVGGAVKGAFQGAGKGIKKGMREELLASGVFSEHEVTKLIWNEFDTDIEENYRAMRNPEKYEREQDKKLERDKPYHKRSRAARMADPDRGINSPAFKKFMADRGM